MAAAVPLIMGVGSAVANKQAGDATADSMSRMASGMTRQQEADRRYLMPTQAEQDQLKQALDVNNQSIQQSQRLLASADPALIAAGQQALQLMQGKSAAALAPIQNQRAQQRNQLMQQLTQRLGPGAATSSAGIQALNNFDQETSNMMAGAQQNTLNSFLGYATGARQLGQGQQQQGIQNLSSITEQGQRMRINAVRGATVNGGLASVGDLAHAQNNQAFVGALGSGLTAAAGGMSGGGGIGSLGGLFGGGSGGMSAGTAAGYGSRTMAMNPNSTPGDYSTLAYGGIVPGEAEYEGDHPDNDTVKALLSPGEGVIKRSDMKNKKKAIAAVNKMFKNGSVKGVTKNRHTYAEGTGSTKLSRQFDPEYQPSPKAPDLETNTAALRGAPNAGVYPATMSEAERRAMAFGGDPRKQAEIEQRYGLPNTQSMKTYSRLAPEEQASIAASHPQYFQAGPQQAADARYNQLMQHMAGSTPAKTVEEVEEPQYWKGGKVKPDPYDARKTRSKYNSNRRKMLA